MKIKICGLSRSEDIACINEYRPDYAGFVFAPGRRQVTPSQAEHLRSGLCESIVPVGVFVNAPIPEIAALYSSGVIQIAQLHGGENAEYITALREQCTVPVIKVFTLCNDNPPDTKDNFAFFAADYFLFDSGAGSGKTFDWQLLESGKIKKPWFLAGGINLDNIAGAMALHPFAIDVSSGVETDGVKDREKIRQLTAFFREHQKNIL